MNMLSELCITQNGKKEGIPFDSESLHDEQKQKNGDYFTASFSPLPAVNLGTFFALILIASPVWGLCPFLADLLATLKVPNPTMVTSTPFFSDLVMASKTASTAAAASFFVLVTFPTSFIRSPCSCAPPFRIIHLRDMEVLINGNSMKYQVNIVWEGDYSGRVGMKGVSLPFLLKVSFAESAFQATFQMAIDDVSH
jgi:hypothetical protein